MNEAQAKDELIVYMRENELLREQLEIATRSNINGVREWEVVKGERDALYAKLAIAVEGIRKAIDSYDYHSAYVDVHAMNMYMYLTNALAKLEEK